MSGNGANPPEMDFSEPQIANFTRAVRATLVTEPSPAVTEQMVRRLADEARASATVAAERTQRRPASAVQPARRGGRRRLALVALAVAGLPLLTAGLAVAGVKLPDAAQNAFEAVGIDLPNQSASDGAGSGDSADDADQGSGNDGAPGDSPAAQPGAGKSDKAVKGGKRKGKGPPDHSNAGGNANPGQSSGSNGKAKGKPAAPPGQSGTSPPKSNAGGNGKSNAGGNSGNAPGQANQPASPGNSGSAGSNGQGGDQGQGGGKPPKE